jgi:hypothetical protein
MGWGVSLVEFCMHCFRLLSELLHGPRRSTASAMTPHSRVSSVQWGFFVSGLLGVD